MPKARVYELAKELGVDSKTVLSKLEAMGEFVKSASSTVEPPVARKLRNAFASSGQGNASDSKKPGHTAKKPVEPASHSMPKPAAPSAPKPAAPAAPKPHHAASKSDAPKPGHRAPRPGESRQHGPGLSTVQVREKLVEALGHTPLQVIIGAIVGFTAGMLF